MCTVSWAAQAAGYRLFFNRDEQRSRTAGLAPVPFGGEGLPFLSPTDPEGGGSWIAVNAAGWTHALLNHYERAGAMPPGKRSRGHWVRACAAAISQEEVDARLAAERLKDFAPFHLLSVSPTGVGSLRTWNGTEVIASEGVEKELPISTSSVDPERVVARRKAIFKSLMAGGEVAPEMLGAFHRHFDNTDPAGSVCMRRDDAETVSLCEISVGKKKIEFRYFARDPSGGKFLKPETTTLERA